MEVLPILSLISWVKILISTLKINSQATVIKQHTKMETQQFKQPVNDGK